MTHTELKDLIPLYALDALPDDEDFELRMHVETCDDCALVLKNHLETAGFLAASVDPVAPLPALKERILDQITAHAPKDELQSRRSAKAGRWFAAVAVAASVAVASWSALLVRRIDTQNDQIAEQRRLLALVSSPAVENVALKSTSELPDANGRVFVDRAEDVSGIVLSGLKEPGDEVYALWLLESGKPKLVENFKPDSSGKAVILVPAEVNENRTVAVTLEPRPDTAAPEGPIVLSA